MEAKVGIGRALRLLRKMRCMTQEDFSDVSSRTYVSSVERGMKSPTVEKINQLAGELQVHPASLLALAFCDENLSDTKTVLATIQKDLNDARTYALANHD